MTTLAALLLLLLFCSPTSPAEQHKTTYPTPPQSMDREVPHSQSPQNPARVDPLQLQREARELADLAQTVPGDIDKLNHGLLPKDTVEKLKRIEKLARQLRGSVAP